MGQYYKVVNLDKKEVVYPSGSKLLEHGYLRNGDVGAVMALLKKEWKGDRIAWIGDYYKSGSNPKVDCAYKSELKEIQHKKKVVKEGFLINHDKNLCIDLSKVTAYEDKIDKGWELSPLAMLTACGNGGGGGDLHDENILVTSGVVGSWAGDKLSVATKPQGEIISFSTLANSVQFISEE